MARGNCAGGAVSVAPALKIQRVREWCAEAEAGLSQTFGHDRDAIVRDVNAGHLELWRLWDGKAWMVTRYEDDVLTCCCYQGERVREAMAAMIEECHRLKVKAIVFFTRRPGLARLLAEFHPEPQETVYRITLQGARA